MSGSWKLPSEDRAELQSYRLLCLPLSKGPRTRFSAILQCHYVSWLGARPMAHSQPWNHTHGLQRCTTHLALENNAHVSSSSAEFPMHQVIQILPLCSSRTCHTHTLPKGRPVHTTVTSSQPPCPRPYKPSSHLWILLFWLLPSTGNVWLSVLGSLNTMSLRSLHTVLSTRCP